MSRTLTAERTQASGQLPFHLVALLGLITGIGPLSTDMYLPAFPILDEDLGGGPGSTQFTLATWFIGLAVGQFSSGPLSDRFGRRGPLMAGLFLYTLASIGCAMTSDYRIFCLFRFLAALGGSTGAVIPRAMIRDIATGREGAKIMTQLTLVFGVMPILAPSIGGMILAIASWRWIFWAAVAYGLAGILSIWFMLPETLPLSRRVRLPVTAVLSRYLFLIREPHFLLNALITSGSSFVMFAYLGGAPVVFEHLMGFSPRAFAVFFGINAAAFILSTQVSGRLVHRFPLEKLMQFGIGWAALAGMLNVGLTVSHIATAQTPLLVVGMIVCMTGSLGFIGANATVLAFHHHGAHAGSASALLGTMQFSLGAVSGLMMGFLPTTSIIPTASVMACGAFMMVAANLVRRRICPGN
ncbi:multidrug effflux MFS transporter [Acetobacter conturbans]|uniref:Bcr/CflA family efflux transporter n=1 Tax=Acetobacter conturbans TaxID=1737472 RepID=A0ABX0K0X1_9PROT|nr:multidrug effflux MFS transporter [Acetobacter conturbans]NHN88759.1 Bcr/CflA family efflux MFS transporter [Acetobacter conturbans]